MPDDAAPWRLRCAHTHLYPGALLRHGAQELPQNWHAGDDLLIEFADLTIGCGTLRPLATAWQLALDARRTARGRAIAAQTWRLQPLAGARGTLRVARP